MVLSSMHQEQAFLFLGRFPVFHFEGKYVIPLGKSFVESDSHPRKNAALLERLRREQVDSPETTDSVAQIVLLPTARCNLCCVYCYANSGLGEKSREMDAETARIAVGWYLKQLPAGAVPMVAFHGWGEPTLRMDLIKGTVKYLAEETCGNFRGSLVSNGMARLEDYQWLFERNFTVTFSVDGPADVQDALRPARRKKPKFGSSEKVERSLREFAARYPEKVIARATVTRETLPRIPEIIRYFASLGVRRASFVGLRCVGRAADSQPLVPSPRDLAKMIGACFSVGQKYGVNVGSIMELFHYGHHRCGCVGGKALCVTPLGQLVACLEILPEDNFWQDYLVGVVDRKKGEVFLFPEKIKGLRRQRDVEALPRCRNCYAKYFCRGGCAIEAQRSSGTISGISEDECAFSRLLFPEIARRVWEHSRSEALSN